MPSASIKKKIPCSKKNLIGMVLDIEKYPEFVPFCQGSKVHERKQKGDLTLIVADLTIGKGPFVDTYKSDVKFNKSTDTIHVTNIEGPLKYLENKWKFDQKENFTEVTFDLDFELKNKFLNIFMNKSFKYGLDKIADAFQSRAEKLFNKV